MARPDRRQIEHLATHGQLANPNQDLLCKSHSKGGAS